MPEPIDNPPNKLEQAKERALDEMSQTQLCNMVLDLPGVQHLDVHDPEHSDQTFLFVTFEEHRHGKTVPDVITVMSHQGWLIENVTFSRRRICFGK